MKNIPKKRFPEFMNDGEWEEKELGDLFKFLRGSVFSKADIIENGLNKCIHYGELFTIYKEKITEIKSYTNLENGQFSQKNDILMPSSDVTPEGLATASAIFEDGIIIGGDVNLLRPKKEVNSLFVSYFLNLSKKEIMKLVSGTTVKHIYNKDISKLSIKLPNPSEQQKIADCLSSLDSLILAQSQKVELLKKHKKGLLQNLFPREGESRPRLRFPEFENDGKWKQKEVGDFFDVGSSKRVLQENWISQGVPFYRTRELVSLSKNEAFRSEIFISEELFLELSKKYGIPSAGDFLISGVGTLGISYQVQNNDKFYFKDGNVIWFKLIKKLNSNYFKYCFQSDYIQNQIFAQSSVSTVGTYTIQNAKKTKFWYPPTFQEQQKIADCLSSLDEQISQQITKLETLKKHKKGLMQQLFPNVNEK